MQRKSELALKLLARQSSTYASLSLSLSLDDLSYTDAVECGVVHGSPSQSSIIKTFYNGQFGGCNGSSSLLGMMTKPLEYSFL